MNRMDIKSRDDNLQVLQSYIYTDKKLNIMISSLYKNVFIVLGLVFIFMFGYGLYIYRDGIKQIQDQNKILSDKINLYHDKISLVMSEAHYLDKIRASPEFYKLIRNEVDNIHRQKQNQLEKTDIEKK